METRRTEKAAVAIARQIMADALRQGLNTGDSLPTEKMMVDKYEAGRATIREALRLLEFQGVLSLKPGPGGGPILRDPSGAHLATTMLLLLQVKRAPFRAIAEVRTTVEPMISRLAAEHMTDVSLAALERSVTDMRDNLNSRDLFLESNKRFHDIIAWSSGNALFGYLVDSLIGIMHGTGLGIDYPTIRRGPILAAHESILDALKNRDPLAAEEQMRAHINAYVTYTEKKYRYVMDETVRWD